MQTIQEAKDYLNKNWIKGVDCPCCGRLVKLYHYSFNSSMARLMIVVYKAYREGRNPVHIEQELHQTGNYSVNVQSKLTHWGLIEPIPNDDPDKNSSGLYRITDLGVEFVKNKIRVPKSIDYYNYKVYKRDEKQVNIIEALGKDFSYQEMMKGYEKEPEPLTTKLF